MAKYRVERESVVQPLDQSIKLIPLTNGYVAVVDAFNYEWLMRWNWYAFWNISTHSFYARRAHNGPLMHRFILGLTDPKIEGDHRDGNTLNNRSYNLRVATRQQNSQNRGSYKNNKSGYSGVIWHSRDQVWQAYINTNGKRTHLGYFRNKDDAFFARAMAEIEQHGRFAHILYH
jgi:hypothetical protein